MSVYHLPIKCFIHEILNKVHLDFRVVGLQHSLYFSWFEVFIRHLLSDEIDVLEGFVWIEEEKFVAIVRREK
jgi:hypothetical protein